MFNDKNKPIIGVIGLGYVGLPLALAFSKNFQTVGFDINEARVKDLNKGKDSTKESEKSLLLDSLNSQSLFIEAKADKIKNCNFYIITVPTPIDENKNPDLSLLKKASIFVGSILNKGDYVTYESTVYPGVTEDICVPILETTSDMIFNKDFFCGYSPERINPGDKIHTLTKIIKITSGSSKKAAKYIDTVYGSIISAGTYMAPSIKVAEAAKVIENAQRDINIAFINELAVIFSKMGIKTHDVLDAASTKWNFLKFTPGLVGGHCIGVDPYYLSHKAQELGYNPEIILSGRRLNDSMPIFIANQIIKKMITKDIKIHNSKVLVLGFSFKEDCPDIRNTKVYDLVIELQEFGCNVDVYDPNVSNSEVKKEYGIEMLKKNHIFDLNKYKAIVIAVGHSKFKELKIPQNKNILVYDIKSFHKDSEMSL